MVSEGVRFATLSAAVLGCGSLMACGSGPALQPPPPPPSVTHHAGGALQGACAAGDRVALARAASVEIWRFPAETPPVFVTAQALGPVLGPPLDHLDCTAGVSVGRGPQRWRLDAQTQELLPLAPGLAQLAPMPRRIDLGAERALQVEPSRFGVSGATGDEQWRPVSGPLTAATWDGEVIWAVGLNGLWRWRPGPGRPTPVPLPTAWAGRALTGVFRDAHYLWVRDAAGVGGALDVRGPWAQTVGEPGPLPVADRGRQVAAAGRVIAGRLGENTLTIDGTPRRLDAPLDAISAWRDGVLLAAGQSLRFWGGADLHEVWRAPLPGATVALFALADGRVMAVGRRYGFLALGFQQPLGQPR